MFIGSLCFVFNKFFLPKTTRCQLGSRTVNPYIIALKHLGIKVQCSNGSYKIDSSRKNCAGFTMYESGDTATEAIIMTALRRSSINLLICMLAARGKSILRNCHAIDRGYENIVGRLQKIGADIERL